MGRQEEFITVIQSMTKWAARKSFPIVMRYISEMAGWLVGCFVFWVDLNYF